MFLAVATPLFMDLTMAYEVAEEFMADKTEQEVMEMDNDLIPPEVIAAGRVINAYRTKGMDPSCHLGRG